MKKIVKILGSAAFVGAMTFITISNDLFDIKEKLKPAPSMSMENIKINYLSLDDERMGDLQFLFGDDLSVKEKIELDQTCVTKVSIQNQYNSDVELQKIIFEAKSIKEDKSPKLGASMRQGANGINLQIINNGWEKAENVTMSFKSDDVILNEIIDEKKLEVKVSKIDAAQELSIPFLNNQDVLIDYHNGELLEPIRVGVIFRDVNGIVIKETANYMTFGITEQGLQFFGSGGPADKFYGIKLDTSKSKCYEEENISEIITAGEILTVPISFFPTSSSSMDFRIGFEIWHNGETDVVYSEYKNLEFFVPSIKDYRIEVEPKNR